MRERPILFSAPMVRALLAGTKTQTRRICKLPPATMDRFDDVPAAGVARHLRETHLGDVLKLCPYGVPGDRLWVREAWSHDAESLEQCRAAHEDMIGGLGYGPYYRATEVAPDTLHWRPSIHMPRWASRITLEVVSVRVERLQDISEADAVAEGTPCYVCGGPMDGRSEADCHCFHSKAKPSDYRALWESINGPGSWDANPWVWCVEFRRVNADAALQTAPQRTERITPDPSTGAQP